MDSSRILRELLAAIPIVGAVIGAAYIVSRHRLQPFDAPTLLAYLIALVALMGIGELVLRYTLLYSLDRKVESLAKLSQALSSGHLAKAFLKDRSQFPPFANRVKDAREIYIMGISLQGMVGYHASIFLEKVREGAKIRFLVMDPTSQSVETTARGLYKANDPAVLRRDIQSTIGRITEMRELDGSAVELRLTNYVPSCGIVLVDPDKDSGVIIVELYPYLVSAASRAHFELTPADGRWYKYFRDQFESVWKNAKVPR